MTDSPQVVATQRRGPAKPRTVLFWIVVIILIAYAMYAIAPWILPVRIVEGPMVQRPAQDAATLVWYTSRPTDCTLAVLVGGQEQTMPAEASGRRHSARVAGLEPGRTYPYEIRTAERPLTDEVAFQTNPTPAERFHFIVFGDSGKGNREQYLLAQRMRAFEPLPDFMLHTGDLVYPDGARHRYNDRFFTPYRHLLARAPFWPCLGNHDVDNEGSAEGYSEVFDLPENGPAGLPPEHNYWFDFGACRVVVIDSNLDETTLRDAVAPWLVAALSAEPAPTWRFVSMHHPPYTAGKYTPDERIQRTLVPAFERAAVDVVFSGHDHNYQRTKPLLGGQPVSADEGVIYVITGAGGAGLYEPRPPQPDYVVASEFEHHSFTHVTVVGPELTLRQIRSDGELIDEYTMRKPATDTQPLMPPATTQPAPARD